MTAAEVRRLLAGLRSSYQPRTTWQRRRDACPAIASLRPLTERAARAQKTRSPQ